DGLFEADLSVDIGIYLLIADGLHGLKPGSVSHGAEAAHLVHEPGGNHAVHPGVDPAPKLFSLDVYADFHVVVIVNAEFMEGLEKRHLLASKLVHFESPLGPDVI